ncbi:MAG: DNA-binding response regulator [Bacteroidia bacterium]|nr:DNA-binding response regulator [Bacteroidia bacterium]
MKKISCIIIDDEPLASELVEIYVQKTPFLDHRGTFNSAVEALKILNEEKIDLVFLDIQMPDMNGIEFSKTLSPETKIIFTTAFKDYAFEGFKVSAVDYLLKPFSYQEFLVAANKVANLHSVRDPNPGPVEKNYIFVKSEYKQVKINLDDVYYFEGLKDYIKIWLLSQPKPVLTLMSLKLLEEELPEDKFMRVHRSFIVALDKINSIERGQILIKEERITIADQYKDKFNKFLETRSIH